MPYQDYIKPELLILIPVLYCIGVALKKSRLPDRWIPLVLGGTSIALSALFVWATSNISGPPAIATALFTAITQGILAAGASVYAHQLYQQSQKEE